ncbi:MAG: hypothetical protein IKE70_05660 [Bacilli bacterium]|nr:hypothetical protein [Bacilli bacterium]
MDENTIIDLKKQHYDNYQKSLYDLIDNNTNRFIDEDLMSLVKQPPLDSMDVLKTKIIDIGKKYKVLVQLEVLEKFLREYRESFLESFEKIRKNRRDSLNKIVNNSNNEVVKFNKKDFLSIDREIKNLVKEKFKESFDIYIIQNISMLFQNFDDSTMGMKISTELTNYFKKNYFKQLFEKFELKLMVKDTILINASKEQSERYIFTLKNSRLFQDFEEEN